MDSKLWQVHVRDVHQNTQTSVDTHDGFQTRSGRCRAWSRYINSPLWVGLISSYIYIELPGEASTSTLALTLNGTSSSQAATHVKSPAAAQAKTPADTLVKITVPAAPAKKPSCCLLRLLSLEKKSEKTDHQ